jgi:hypothetical protein
MSIAKTPTARPGATKKAIRRDYVGNIPSNR